jgi:D-3-phosphoglycerate dehydrogenase
MKHKIAVITPVKHLPGVPEMIEKKGEVFYLEEGNKTEVRDLLLYNNIDTIICNPNQQTYKIDSWLLDGTNITLINTCSTGMNHIDVDYCRNAGIKIYSLTNDYKLINELPSTAELAFGLMLSLLRQITESIKHVTDFKWDYTQFIGRQIKDLNIGIIGYGRLGKMMAKYCDTFGANVYVYDPYEVSEPDYIDVDIKEMFEICDVISLHVHVTPETKYMINEQLLGISQNKPYIINTSRGEIVYENHIVSALKNGIISGYGTDVIENEFDDLTKSPIISAMNRGENIIVTPHTGGMTIEGQTKAFKWAINKL